MALAPGARLGAYEIVALLGAGGMGEVYRARDTRLGRDVAIKILPEVFVRDPERHARFEREARVISQLNHPNICGFYHIGDAPSLDPANPQSQTPNPGTMQFLVLELVDGPTLAERIAQGPLPLDEALPIARQIADALEAAHEHGIVHRDLKPANIKIRSDGTVKVLDFGLAKALEPAASPNINVTQSPTITSPAMTGQGIILGTAAYMSPEQARGSSVDRRADLWAFGVVLYEMLAGRRLFEGTTISDTLASVLKSEPDWSALPVQTPIPIRRLLRRCLEKDRRRRLDSAADARLELEDALTAPSEIVQGFGPAGATPTRPPTSWRRLAVVGLLSAIVAGAGVGGLAWWHARVPALVVSRFSVPLGEGQSFTNLNDPVVAMSPDGTRFVYVANRQLYLRALSDSAARPITGTDLARPLRTPVFSPDGEFIAFSSDADGGTLKKIAVSGGIAVTLCSATPPFGISWGTDGILFAQPRGIMRVSASGGQPELLVATKDGEMASDPQVLPDGRTLLFTLAASTGPPTRLDKGRIVMQSLGSGERKTLIEGGSSGRYSPSGHLLYALQGVMLAVPFDANRLAITGVPVPVIEGIARGAGLNSAATMQFSLSSTGSLVYLDGPVSTFRRDLAWLDRRGLVEPLKLPAAVYTTPRLSPDGRRIAFVTDDGEDANVWIFDLAGSGAPRRLTFGGQNRFPAWSSDGGRVAFQSDREGDLALFWQNPDGTGPAERLTKPEPGTAHVPHSWASDGKHLLFGVVKGARTSLWTYAVADRQSVRFGQAETSDARSAVFSPDGRWVAYSAAAPTPAQSRMFVQPFPATGATYQVSRPETQGNNPFWSPDGGELFYARGPGDFAVVRITTQPSFSVSSPTAIPSGGRLAEGGWRQYDISRDGKRFLVVVPYGQGNTIERPPEVQVVLNWFEELKRRMPTK